MGREVSEKLGERCTERACRTVASSWVMPAAVSAGVGVDMDEGVDAGEGKGESVEVVAVTEGVEEVLIPADDNDEEQDFEVVKVDEFVEEEEEEETEPGLPLVTVEVLIVEERVDAPLTGARVASRADVDVGVGVGLGVGISLVTLDFIALSVFPPTMMRQ